MTRTAVIGDIHGCIEEFNELLYYLDLKPTDTLISLGDLLHKGPYSAEVVKLLREVNCLKVLISGNHEEKQLRWYGYELTCQINGSKNPLEDVEEYPAVQASLCQEDLDFIKSAYLYYTFRVKEKKFLCVHGGVSSQTLALPGESLLMRDLFLLPGKFRKHLLEMLRLRYESPDGKMVRLGEETAEDTYWAEKYNGRFGTVLFGHQPFFFGPKHYKHAIGLDTGCVHGDLLTAYVVETESGRSYPVSVKAKLEYRKKKLIANFRPN